MGTGLVESINMPCLVKEDIWDNQRGEREGGTCKQYPPLLLYIRNKTFLVQL